MFEVNIKKQLSFNFGTVYTSRLGTSPDLSILMTENIEIITNTVGAFHCYDKRS